jgi:hypothetical protein
MTTYVAYFTAPEHNVATYVAYFTAPEHNVATYVAYFTAPEHNVATYVAYFTAPEHNVATHVAYFTEPEVRHTDCVMLLYLLFLELLLASFDGYVNCFKPQRHCRNLHKCSRLRLLFIPFLLNACRSHACENAVSLEMRLVLVSN